MNLKEVTTFDKLKSTKLINDIGLLIYYHNKLQAIDTDKEVSTEIDVLQISEKVVYKDEWIEYEVYVVPIQPQDIQKV